MKQRIVFRCDASMHFGSGHVMRCLTLANLLRENGADVLFICREHNGHLIDLIKSKGYDSLRLPIRSAADDGEAKYINWLGATVKEDVEESINALKSIGQVDWLVVDHYALDAKWENSMRAYTERIMVIDDLANRTHDCDLLLDQNLQLKNTERRYEGLLPKECKKLIGPKYALLRPEFELARNTKTIHQNSVKRIFVFFGGNDVTNETAKVLQAIKQLNRSDLAIDVVIGASKVYYDLLTKICAQLSNAKIHIQIDNVAELMSKADIAIGAGGGAMWERCSLGLPSIVLSVAENQQPGCEALSKFGGIFYLGNAENVSCDLMQSALHLALDAPQLFKYMSEKCFDLVDAQGAKRVARVMRAPTIVLRAAVLDDCESIFNWRNAEETRRFSGSTDVLTLIDHITWYSKALKNESIQLLIGEVEQQAVGVLRFDRHGEKAVISIYLVPGYYGKGMGRQLIEQGGVWIKQHWPEVRLIEALIIKGNEASLAVFSEAGFVCGSYIYVKRME
jgi:UDP-2,4-diacetamido-2,4,6-trideoxy-beta-L-altropyranose hydrolase